MPMYARDILSKLKLPQPLVISNAIFGSVLRIDSTKKVCKKLEETTAGSEAMSGGSSCLCSHRIRGSGGLGHRTHLEVQRRPSRIPTAAVTEIAVLSIGRPGVHSCLLSGTSTTTYTVLHVKNCSWLHF